MKPPRTVHYARLSRDREPEPCTREQWRAWVDRPHHAPVLVRQMLEGWEADLTFTGTWFGRGTPQFFTLRVTPPQGFSHLRQFATYEQAWRALGRLLAERWRQAEAGDSGPAATLQEAVPGQFPLGAVQHHQRAFLARGFLGDQKKPEAGREYG